MVEFETVEAKEIKFGNNKFLEVAKKRAKTPEGESEIISISKGFITPTGQKRFKNALGFESNKQVLDELVEALNSLSIEDQAEAPAGETAEAPTEEAPAETTEEA